MKQKNPYKRLLDDIKDWCRQVQHRHSREMFIYPKDRLGEVWSLVDLYERVAAAEQLGYDVHIVADSTRGLVTRYIKKVPPTPYAWQ